MDKDFLWEMFEEKFSKETQKRYAPPPIQIGTHRETGEILSTLIEGFDDEYANGLSSTHSYVLGRSGSGKTKWLEGFVRTIIQQGYGAIVLDGKAGETCLYNNLLDYCTYLDLKVPHL